MKKFGIEKNILFRPNLSIINLSIFLKTKNSKQGKENDVKVRGGIATDGTTKRRALRPQTSFQWDSDLDSDDGLDEEGW